MALLSKEEIDGRLRETRGWWLHSGGITKDYSFNSEEEAKVFADNVSSLAASMGKHPTVQVEGAQVLLATHTRSEGGVTHKDIAFANELEKIAIKVPARK